MAEFDLRYYKDEDIYSDGDIENDILEIVKSKNYSILDSDDVLPYPIIYHLSKLRENILNWYFFKENAKVLEIGSGCGAITGLLCEKCANVVSVELSKRRALINYERNKNRDNLRIVVGNLNDMELNNDFDYIILNGVLEYACSFTDGDTPFVSFIKNISHFLKIDGRILIAIENRLGLKYFSGSAEDHTDIHFLGLNNYDGVDSVRTFSKAELQVVLESAGLNYTQFYYPYPDYKFPNEIFTDESIKTISYGRPYNSFEHSRIELFNQNKMFESLRKEGVVDKFANSFLVEASFSELKCDKKLVYAKCNNDRLPQYRINTIIFKNINGKKIVRKKSIVEEAKKHINNIKRNKTVGNEKCINSSIIDYGEDYVDYSFYEQKNLNDLICSYAQDGNNLAIWDLLKEYYDTFFSKGVIENYNSLEFENVFGDNIDTKKCLCIKPANIDLILDNIFLIDNKFVVIDNEWLFDFYVPVKFIVWRMINELYSKNGFLNDLISEKDLFDYFEIEQDDINRYLDWALHFVYHYVGGDSCRASYQGAVTFPIQTIIDKYVSRNKVNSKIYINNGSGYSEDNVFEINQYINKDGSFELDLELDLFVDSLRFDPADVPCICSNIEIYLDNQKQNFENNALKTTHNDVFPHNDPWYEVKNISNVISCVKIKGSIEFLEDDKTISILNDYRNGLECDVMQKTELINSLNQELDQTESQLREEKRVSIHWENLSKSQKEIITNQDREIEALHAFENYVEQSYAWKYTKWHRRKTWNNFLNNYRVPLNIDIFEYKDNCLVVKGWILLEDTNYQLVYSTGKYERILNVIKGIERSDVSSIYNTRYNAYGFLCEWHVEKLKYGKIILKYQNAGIDFNEVIGECGQPIKEELLGYLTDIKHSGIRKYIPSFNPSDIIKNLQEIRRSVDIPDALSDINAPNIELVRRKYDSIIEPELPEDLVVDVVVPVFNGYDYLYSLFDSLYRTGVNIKVFIVNDCSTDDRVSLFLKTVTANNKNTVVIENEINMGFVKSVNKALEKCKNHVVIVNTDVELPNNWLERLIEPIINNENIASVTPFTTSGTICSFPDFCKDNKLFAGLDVNKIDSVFSNFKPIIYEVPTGVGFCMAMNKIAIQKIGLLDELNFGKGYGEENDWCQRAIYEGFTNVHLCNLFVFHNHGGSFAGDEKIKLINEHAEILLSKHPNYNLDVAKYVEKDPAAEIRNYALYRLILKYLDDKILYFNHALGGGANDYLIIQRQKKVREKKVVATITYEYSISAYKFQLNYQEHEVSYMFYKIEYLMEELSNYKFDEVYINELVSYPDLFETMRLIKDYCSKKNSKLIMLMHDYFALCPGINLLDSSKGYCNLSHCDNCEIFNQYEYDNNIWKSNWYDFLTACNEIIVFSHDSENILSKKYGVLNNIVYLPHVVNYMPKLEKNTKITQYTNIGVLGVMSLHKGFNIIKKMIEEIDERNLPIRIIHFGNSDDDCDICSDSYIDYGRYRVGQLPHLIYKYDIDVFFIPSIWPETFSYTTQEIIEMNMPVAVLPIGAPAERVNLYSKGHILKSWKPEEILDDLSQFANNYKIDYISTKKVLIVREYQSFSSRYRAEHLAEQLLFQGIDYDYYDIQDVDVNHVPRYDALIVYRCRFNKKIQQLVNIFKIRNKKIYYDIDDYIFNYNEIKDEHFLKGEDYNNFENYIKDIKLCMELFDSFITSTIHLKKEIINNFPNSNVYLNRNSASCEMLIESLRVCDGNKNNNRIILGYFSGSKTHDDDFALIENVILDVLKKYDNVYLKVVGCLQLNEKFSLLSERIIKNDFVDWQKLPGLIQSVDINLMPLVNNRFTMCKSENKWMEAALVKVPTIASFNEELSLCIDNGVNGILCNNDEWYDRLCDLIENESLRTSIAEQAYEKCINYKTTLTAKINLDI